MSSVVALERTASHLPSGPFVAKTKYFEATCSVMKSASEEEDGEPVATVHIEYSEIDPADKEALDGFTNDLDDFRKEVK